MPSKCIICNIKYPIYSFSIDDKKAEYCFNCKKEGMINITTPKCIICNNKRSNYGLPDDKIAQYCYNCKKEGMIDITHKKCIICNNKRPNFGLLDDKIAQYCYNCKKEGMIDIKTPKCIECKKTIPIFGFPTDKISNYCSKCKKEGMINLKDPKCKSEWCNTLIRKKYHGYCCYCFMHLFPDKQVSRNYKTKEKYVVDYIKEQFKEIDIIADKQIHGGCSKRRPDILIDLGHQIIIVEIDENQHINYDCSCENKRIMELSQDVGHRPIIFIRFNPDDYKINLKNITSCWKLNKQGICTIKKNKQEEWKERLKILEEQIKYWLNNKTSKLIEVIQLFYDQ